MSVKPVTVNQCTCERCGYKWVSEILPKQCPKCRSPYWQTPRGELRRGRKKKGLINESSTN